MIKAETIEPTIGRHVYEEYFCPQCTKKLRTSPFTGRRYCSSCDTYWSIIEDDKAKQIQKIPLRDRSCHCEHCKRITPHGITDETRVVCELCGTEKMNIR